MDDSAIEGQPGIDFHRQIHDSAGLRSGCACALGHGREEGFSFDTFPALAHRVAALGSGRTGLLYARVVERHAATPK